MKDFGKDFDTIDQARTRPIEIGRSVDSVKLSTPSRQKSSTPVFFDCPLERKSARHENDDFGLSFQDPRSEEHTSELQSRSDLVCRLLLEKKKKRRCGS